MKKIHALIAAAALTASPAFAANYVVYVHGRLENVWKGGFKTVTNYANYDFGSNWNGTTQRIDQLTSTAYSNIKTRCGSGNACILVGYSTGGLIAEYMHKVHGVVPVKTVTTANAGGGSELADNCNGFTNMLVTCYATGVDYNLRPSWARGFGYSSAPSAVYSHIGNTNAYNGWWYLTAASLPGDDDSAVAFHSAQGCSGAGSQSKSCSRWTNWASSRNYYYEGGLFSAGTDHYSMPAKALGSI